MKVPTITLILHLLFSNGLGEIISCDLLAEEVTMLKERILKIEDCISNSQMHWVKDSCQKRPTITVTNTTHNETDSGISPSEKCNSHVNSFFIDGFCYYFYNGYRTYETSQYICYEHFKHLGMENGRLFEPRIPSNHRLVYKSGWKYFLWIMELEFIQKGPLKQKQVFYCGF